MSGRLDADPELRPLLYHGTVTRPRGGGDSVEAEEPAEEESLQRAPDVAGYLRNLIVSRQLRAGDRVRAESIAQELRVSATPVREALRSLQAEGFLIYQRNRGFVVARLSGADVRDVFVAIGLLAGELAARAASTASAEDLAPMKRVQEQLRAAAAAGDLDDVGGLVNQFYYHLHALGQSPKIVTLVLTLDRYTPQGLFPSTPGWLETVMRFHDLLISAIEAREPEAARAAVHGQMAKAAELMAGRFESMGDDEVPAAGPAHSALRAL